MDLAAFAACAPLGRRGARRARACGVRACAARVVVVGGGPAGYFSAIGAARGAGRVVLLERGGAVLGKVRVSGGGRCNVTNDARGDVFHLGYPHGRGRSELRGALRAWGKEDTVRWFEGRGVALKVEAGGKVFPVSDDSGSVVEALVGAAREGGVEVRTGARVVGVERAGDGFVVALDGGGEVRADVVCVATGGAGCGRGWAASLGHRVVPAVPALFTFKVRDARLEGLAGVSVADARVSLRARGARGERLAARGPLLITHWGLSGPAVLLLSSAGARVLGECGYRAEVVVDFCAGLSREEKGAAVRAGRGRWGGKLVGGVVPVPGVPARLWRRLAGGGRWGEVGKREALRLVEALHEARFQVVGKGEFKEEFVSAGGVDTRDVDMRTFESKRVPGLFVVGEALNVDGMTGGYNFQSCWSAGHAAGAAIAARMDGLAAARGAANPPTPDPAPGLAADADAMDHQRSA